jgi:hypothetical protein
MQDRPFALAGTVCYYHLFKRRLRESAFLLRNIPTSSLLSISHAEYFAQSSGYEDIVVAPNAQKEHIQH